MFITNRTVMALACALTVVASGCSAPPTSDQPVIVVANYPLEYLATRLAPWAQIVDLTPPGAEPHDLELTASQMESIATATVVVYEKGFQAAVDQAIATTTPAVVVDVSQNVDMMPLTDAASSQLDPHIWLDPVRYQQMAADMATAIAKAEPDRAAAVTSAHDALVADLTGLDGRFSASLATCERQAFITTHAAFGYLAQRYHLTQVAIDGLDPTSEPSAARLAEVQTLARQYGVTTIFYETLVPRTVADQVAHDLGLKTDVLDPIEGITPDSPGTDYLSVMDANLTALRTANGCS